MYFLLLTSAFCYSKIYLKLRSHKIAFKNLSNQAEQHSVRAFPNIARYRKTVCTAVWVQLALIACYLPYGIVTAVAHTTEYSPSHNLAVRFAVTMAFLNSTLNPFLYCWKIREMRKAVKGTIKQLICSSWRPGIRESDEETKWYKTKWRHIIKAALDNTSFVKCKFFRVRNGINVRQLSKTCERGWKSPT